MWILFRCDITVDVDYAAYISEVFSRSLQREGKETASFLNASNAVRNNTMQSKKNVETL
jgi:hypothetical protein